MNSITRRIAATAAVAGVAIALSGCAPASGTADAEGGDTIRVGALATPAGDILEFVSENLADDAGLTIEFTEFTDYNTPNIALSDGSIDANLFQNDTFLATYNDSVGASLVSVGEAYLPSGAFYSDTIGDVDELKDGATVAIPNDPTNEGRALGILAAAGLIETTANPTVLSDITSNPRGLEFVEIENATLPQAVADVDAAFVTVSFALPAGLTADQAILVEGADSDYVNVLATTEELEGDPRVQKLYELLLDPQTTAFIEETWGGLVVPVAS